MTQTRYLVTHRCENARTGKLSVKEVLSWSTEKKKMHFWTDVCGRGWPHNVNLSYVVNIHSRSVSDWPL